MSRPPVAALLVDFDGTVIDTESPEYLTVAAEFDRHGAEYTLDEHRTNVGRIDHPAWTDVLMERVGRCPISTQRSNGGRSSIFG